MSISVFDMFTIGIGPSSSHTVGPMRAARTFVLALESEQKLSSIHSITAELFGSLGHTGKGHGSDKAIMLGLMGDRPSLVDTDTIPSKIQKIQESHSIAVLGKHSVNFGKENLVFHRKRTLPRHPNGMTFTAFDSNQNVIMSKSYYSIGGGFVIDDAEPNETILIQDSQELPYLFRSADELLKLCKETGLSIATLMLENEKIWRPEAEIKSKLLDIWQAMQACIQKGCDKEGVLPGGLKVVRRAPSIYRKLKCDPNSTHDQLNAMDWVNLFALAVNEENAAGGRVVTAPTNGAAGIIPAVLNYYHKFIDNAQEEDAIRFLLTAGAIGILYKMNASISGAEVGCQGEVGVACSMAAAGLTEIMGGTPEQVENAAEVGMEHNLGLTCDPVGGLVQVPCIERNAMGAIKAINASRLALRGDGNHKVSLDKVIRTMRETGADMKSKYKETARGGLAVNIIEC
ncbi:MAG: L-serine ammonia-lyase [Pseudomonadota bacterium]